MSSSDRLFEAMAEVVRISSKKTKELPIRDVFDQYGASHYPYSSILGGLVDPKTGKLVKENKDEDR